MTEIIPFAGRRASRPAPIPESDDPPFEGVIIFAANGNGEFVLFVDQLREITVGGAIKLAISRRGIGTQGAPYTAEQTNEIVGADNSFQRAAEAQARRRSFELV